MSLKQAEQNTKKRVVFIVGPTAIGKSDVGMFLAAKLNGEIISCDSMQIYKGMDIITSKPSLASRRRVPHHLLDMVEPCRVFNVSRYRSQALKAIKDIVSSGKTPIFVGGTGLYMSIVIDGIFKVKAQNKDIRSRLYREADEFGGAYLHKRLFNVDPQSAGKIHPNDIRRIVRALEVFEVTGQPISKLQPQRNGISDKYDISIFCLDMERKYLNERIDKRLESMFRRGLIKEIKTLLKTRLSKTARYAIGIKELKSYFDGDLTLKEAKETMKKNTRNYAKRQLTWFRKDKRIKWIRVEPGQSPRIISEIIWKELS